MDNANPAAAAGCWQCHGSRVQIQTDENGYPKYNDLRILLLDAKTWPNTGMGRINLDGSKGSCTACHNRHHFSVAQARQPENCGKCHMSATPDQQVTHDVGDRISWTLQPKVSEKIYATELSKYEALGKPLPENFLIWEQRRKNMQNVCFQCHTKDYVYNFYTQYDNEVYLYNDKFGKPALTLMKVLKAEGLISPVPFDDKIEWIYFYLWHHEGRRARTGASMMGPDYTQWHGNFEVADRFYMEMVPEVKELIADGNKHGKNAQASKVQTIFLIG